MATSDKLYSCRLLQQLRSRQRLTRSCRITWTTWTRTWSYAGTHTPTGSAKYLVPQEHRQAAQVLVLTPACERDCQIPLCPLIAVTPELLPQHPSSGGHCLWGVWLLLSGMQELLPLVPYIVPIWALWQTMYRFSYNWVLLGTRKAQPVQASGLYCLRILCHESCLLIL